jgi:hypothetical protein
MFFKRIKRLLKERNESLFLTFEIAHFLIDVIIVAEMIVAHLEPFFRSSA